MEAGNRRSATEQKATTATEEKRWDRVTVGASEICAAISGCYREPLVFGSWVPSAIFLCFLSCLSIYLSSICLFVFAFVFLKSDCHTLTQSHSFVHSPTHPLTHPLTHSPIQSCTYSHNHLLCIFQEESLPSRQMKGSGS